MSCPSYRTLQQVLFPIKTWSPGEANLYLERHGIIQHPSRRGKLLESDGFLVAKIRCPAAEGYCHHIRKVTDDGIWYVYGCYPDVLP